MGWALAPVASRELLLLLFGECGSDRRGHLTVV